MPKLKPAANLVLKVAIPSPLAKLFDYLAPMGVPTHLVPIGVRVKIPFGRRECIGFVVEHGPSDLKELIQAGIASSSIALLGNPIRKYLEHSLKEICVNLDVKVSFRFNDINEKRMPDEMLNELKSKINKSSSELKVQIPVIERVTNSSILGNLLSHDNPFNPKLGDLTATGTPASSSSVGATSTVSASPAGRDPAATLGGYRSSSGLRIDSS